MKVVRSAAALCAAVALSACGTGGSTTGDTVSGRPSTARADVAHGSWTKIAAAPLSPRHSSIVAWSGTEVLVIGGDTFVCSGGYRAMLSCDEPDDQELRDGAAYDPRRDSWRPISPAPVRLWFAGTALLGDTLFVLQNRDFLSYDIPTDRWRRLPPPSSQSRRIAVIAGELIAYRDGGGSGVDQMWDPDAERWRPLPPPPREISPSRVIVDLDGVGVLVGQRGYRERDHVATGVAVAFFDPRSRRWSTPRYRTDREGRDLVSFFGRSLFVVDGTVIAASLQRPTGRVGVEPVPFGAALDPAQGWSRLPDRPISATEREARDDFAREIQGKEAVPSDLAAKFQRFSWLSVSGDDFIVVGRWAYDVESRAWQHVPSDDGPLDLLNASAVWAGDRVFAWGGTHGDSDNVATGWTWRPYRPGDATAGAGPAAGDGGSGGSGGGGAAG